MSKTKKKPLRIKLSENASLLLASFAIAFVAWIFAKAGESEEASIVVPVVAAVNDPRLEIKITPPAVPVTLRYPKDMEGSISSERFRFVVDTSDLKQGLGLDWKTKSQPLTARDWSANVQHAGRIQLLRIGLQSNTVEVKIRWNAQPAVVDADVTGEDHLAPGLQLVGSVKVSPRDVWVVGDKQMLDSLPRDEATSRIKLMTEKINIADYTQSALEMKQIMIPAGVEIVQPPVKAAEVNLEIQEIQTVREIANVKLDFHAISPETVQLDYKEKTGSVTVFGPKSLLAQLTPDSFEVALVRPSEEVPGTTKDLTLDPHFAPSVTEDMRAKLVIKSINPKTIRVHYLTKSNP